MITYQREHWDDCVDELRGIWKEQWQSLGTYKDRIELAVDEPKYEQAEATGILIVVTMRDDGKLIGYFTGMTTPHMHHSGVMICWSDVYYLLPEYRKGANGMRFLQAVMRLLKDAGVIKLYLSTKVHEDHGALLEVIGMKLTDRVYTKFL